MSDRPDMTFILMRVEFLDLVLSSVVTSCAILIPGEPLELIVSSWRDIMRRHLS